MVCTLLKLQLARCASVAGGQVNRQHLQLSSLTVGWAEAWPVAIVGAGPTGLTLSLLLSKLGIRNVVFEATKAVTQHPQAGPPLHLLVAAQIFTLQYLQI